ncbi:PE-PGRS family protein [Amycolatopsis suaedae]|uniref:PE-PGRS family protein n=1 Tax=Amycolatopsis suaedae TaxID=2510978 RepID=A0A4Q7JB62_9PSEU|nr:PE-PGRS family protein [Amycolatopsis suaedae]RZQ65050.1 PE-PGRS family protein [Amycolatopsis suaedae]
MQTWAKRGLQTALVTGGLLMLGTGIASADEKVNPDSPAGPLDVNLTVPLQIDQNALGLPGKQVNLPGVDKELSTKPVTSKLKGLTAPLQKAAAPAEKATAPLAGATSKATGALSGVTSKATERVGAKQVTPPSLESNGDVFKGNKVDLDLTVPIQICGNAIGVLGDAAVEGDCVQSYSNDEDTSTDGKNSGLAGNAVVLDWALPIQIAGNAGGVAGGSGYTTGVAEQEVTETGDIKTDGTGSGTSGNVVAGQFATPVQVTGNAASWILGNAYSDFEAETEAESGGSIQTNGDGGSVAGNAVGVPIGLPVKFNGNAAGVWGSDADSTSHSEADATAGGTTPGLNGNPSYIQTGGDKSFLSGNIAQPQGALLANVTGNAGSWIGNATTGNALDGGEASSTTSEVQAGGFSSTTGDKSGGSGNVADLPIALPAEVFGVGGTYIGNAHANADSETATEAGGGTYSTGNGSVLAGNTVTGQGALAPEVFGIGGSHIGNASGTASEDKVVTAGGYNGTQGNDSSASGNLVQVPLAVPAEVFGVGGSYIGQGKGAASETKEITAGGGGNTDDDNGFGTSNLVATPVSLPVQAFGIGGSHIGRGSGQAVTDTQVTSGGDVKATGKKAGLAGNIGFVPVALPLQVHGVGGSFIGTGHGASENLTDAVAGGDAKATGEDGAVAGNIIQAPFAGVGDMFGSSAGLAALVGGQTAVNDVVAEAGGDSETNGDGGGLAGNVISAQGLPIAQVFGDAVAAAAKASGAASNSVEATSGGDITTSGEEGAFSGNILDVPAAAVAQVFGNSVAGLGVADAVADNNTVGTVGGSTDTSGSTNSLSGIDGQLPVGVLAQIFDVPLEVLGVATADATNATVIDVAGDEPQINLPIDGSAMPINALPKMPMPALPGVPSPGMAAGETGLPGLPGLPGAGELPVPGLPGLPQLPVPGGARSDVPGLDALPGLDGLPAFPGVPTNVTDGLAAPVQISSLNGLPMDVTSLPTLPAVPGVPTDVPTTVPALDAPSLLPQADVPALAQVDSGPLSLFQRILDGFAGKFRTQ